VTTITYADAEALGALTEAARLGLRVEWIDADNNHHSGVLRHIVHDAETASFLNETDNVWEAFVRITGTFDYFLPVPEVVAMLRGGTFVVAR
jgi:hypothetical protein